MNSIDQSHPVKAPVQGSPDGPTGEAVETVADQQSRSVVMRWLLHDIPYIAMLLLALAGVVLRLPVGYWFLLTPIFGLISIIEGWRKSITKTERLGFVVRITLDWCAVLLAIYLLYGNGVQGVMNKNSSSLVMILLLALGTFVAGIQVRVWQLCAVGLVLFLAVPSVGWLDQSPLLLTVAALVIVAIGGVTWWVMQLGSTTK
jgi:hypothetical protein